MARAREIDVRFHVGDWRQSGLVVLDVSFVAVDLFRTFRLDRLYMPQSVTGVRRARRTNKKSIKGLPRTVPREVGQLRAYPA